MPRASETAITLRGIDRFGQRSPLSFAFIVPVGMDTPQPEYETNANGVVHLPRGRFLAGVDIFTPAEKGSPDSSTVGGLTLQVTGHPKTVTADARRGVPVRMTLTGAAATQDDLDAAVCEVDSHKKRVGSQPVVVASSGSGERLYVIPSGSAPAQFEVTSDWIGADGRQYLLARTSAGIPAGARSTFRASALGTLVLQAASGASEGSSGFMEAMPIAACGAVAGGQRKLPCRCPDGWHSRSAPGFWSATFFPKDSNDDTASLAQKVAARHRVTRTFGAAVRGPDQRVLPVFDRFLRGKDFYFSTLSLFADPTARGDECCERGTIAVRAHGKVLKKVKFVTSGARPFEANLRKPGLYTVDISATRQPPHSGVTPAILSTRIHLTREFKATVNDLQSDHTVAPVSVTTLRPVGLDLGNDAKPRVTTEVRLTIKPGQNPSKDAIKSVLVQASDDDGGTWRTVPVSGKGLSRLARVKDPASGFVSLRTTVTDVHGDTTIETIYRAYGIS